MNALTPNDIFDFFSQSVTQRSAGAIRVSRAVVKPGSDPDADASLVRFRKSHVDLLNSPRLIALVQQLKKEEEGPIETLVLAKPEAKRADWRSLFDRLIVHCRAELAGTAASTETPEGVVSSILSSFLRRDSEGQYGDLHDHQQLWPLLIAIAGRKLRKKKLTEKIIADRRFGSALGEILEEAFRDIAREDRRQAIFAHSLFGNSARRIGQLLDEDPEDIASVIRTIHAELHLMLPG